MMGYCWTDMLYEIVHLLDGVLSLFNSSYEGYLEEKYQAVGNYTREVLLPHISKLSGVEVDYYFWFLCVALPVAFTVLLPFVLMSLFYITAIVVQVVRLKHRLVQAAEWHDWRQAARVAVSIIWETHSYIWNGYSVVGMHKLPADGQPALLVYYHAEVPVDCYYLMAQMVLYKKRVMRVVADRFVFKLPGFQTVLQVFDTFPGTREECEGFLQSGDLVILSPGGTREMYYSDGNYSVDWGRRLGFAKLALKTQVPVYPIFTRNIREVFHYARVQPLWGLLLRVYEKYKLPIAFPYGGFPVKLTTYIGDPIMTANCGLEPEDLSRKVQDSLRALIAKHQPIPGSVLRALGERFYHHEA